MNDINQEVEKGTAQSVVPVNSNIQNEAVNTEVVSGPLENVHAPAIEGAVEGIDTPEKPDSTKVTVRIVAHGCGERIKVIVSTNEGEAEHTFLVFQAKIEGLDLKSITFPHLNAAELLAQNN